MTERLQRALEHLDELSPEAQEDLAQQIEEQTELLHDLPEIPSAATGDDMPRSVRDALALAGAWSDLQGDDEFAAFDRIRHETKPSPRRHFSINSPS